MGTQKGFSLIELLIVTCIGVFILSAAFMLQAGSVKLFRDTKTTTDNLQTKAPSIELISRYFDRWGAGVVATGADCSTYPPKNAKCIAKTTGASFDEVTFWGSIYGTGCVESVAGGSANMFSCRLNKTGNQNRYYVWRNNVLVNDMSGSAVIPLVLNSNLTPENADCSGLSSSNATVTATMTPVSGSTNKDLQAGDTINRAPHRIRLHVAANANDGGRNWLYAAITDTAASGMASVDVPVAPVNGFRVNLLPSSCNAGLGECTSAEVDVTFRSQSARYDGGTENYRVARVFGR